MGHPTGEDGQIGLTQTQIRQPDVVVGEIGTPSKLRGHIL